MINKKIFTDPVCLMETSEDDVFHKYHQKTYYFCSEQCRQRFIEKPLLYISDSGHLPAKKSEGQIIHQRKFLLNEELSDMQAAQLFTALKKLMGILHVEVKGKEFSICYDLLQTSAEQIEQRVEEVGNELYDGFGESLKRGFIHYLEDTELENLTVN